MQPIANYLELDKNIPNVIQFIQKLKAHSGLKDARFMIQEAANTHWQKVLTQAINEKIYFSIDAIEDWMPGTKTYNTEEDENETYREMESQQEL